MAATSLNFHAPTSQALGHYPSVQKNVNLNLTEGMTHQQHLIRITHLHQTAHNGRKQVFLALGLRHHFNEPNARIGKYSSHN